MKPFIALGGLALAIWAGAAQAGDFPISGSGATGHAGDRVFVSLVYDYDVGFGVMAEDLQFEYQFASMTFVPDASTIDVFGVTQNLVQYEASLQQFARDHQGDATANLDAVGSAPDFRGYALSFYTGDGATQGRIGLVHLHVAFDILATAAPGVSQVSFTDVNGLFDGYGNGFTYPAELQHLSVTVTAVPEPHIGWMLLAGIGLIGCHRLRRSSPFGTPAAGSMRRRMAAGSDEWNSRR